MFADENRAAIVSSARAIFDTLDDYSDQLNRAASYLQAHGLQPKTTEYFSDLLVESDTPGLYAIVGFNRAAESRLHETLPLPLIISPDDNQFFSKLAELVRWCSWSGGRFSASGKSIRVTLSPESASRSHWVYFFHKAIWKFYKKTPVALVAHVKWVLENINGSVVSIFWDEQNTASEWQQQLLAKPDFILNLSHGRLVDGLSSLCAGTDEFGRPTELMSADFLASSLRAAGQAPRFVLAYACHSAQTDALSTPFLTAGTEAFVGWNEMTPAYSDTVDQICSELFPNAFEAKESVGQTIGRLTSSGILPLQSLVTPTTLLIKGNADLKWWQGATNNG